MNSVDEDESILLINEFKVSWFTLLSRVDAAPTVDEIVLSSLNRVANLIISDKSEQDYILDMALNLCVFETIFRWNFIFTGSDLEAFKAKELHFYDTLISNEGKKYLQHRNFVIPLLATIHHCSMRSSIAVERALVRILNSVCVVLCSQNFDLSTTSTYQKEYTSHASNKLMNTLQPPIKVGNLFLFRYLCMGIIDYSHINGVYLEFDNNFLATTTNASPSTSSVSSASFSCSKDPAKLIFNSTARDGITHGNEDDVKSSGWTSVDDMAGDKFATIDSICDLLAPYIFRDGDLGWQARDSLLLLATYSLRDEEFSHIIAQYSSICAVIATGLGMLYTSLPHSLVKDNTPETWPILSKIFITNKDANTSFTEFVRALDFCRSLLEVAHPLIQSCLLHCIHSVFFVSVIGPSLTQSTVENVTTATIYLEQLIVHSVGSAILPVLLRFFMTKLSHSKTPYPNCSANVNRNHSSTISSDSNFKVKLSNGGDSVDDNESYLIVANENQLEDDPTYMDLLISRLHHCNSLLGIATMSLVNTIIDLHCEDVMFFLILRHLVPIRDKLYSIGWSWPEANNLTDSSVKFLKLLTPPNTTNSHRQLMKVRPTNGHTIAQLNIDDVEQYEKIAQKTSYKNGWDASFTNYELSTEPDNLFEDDEQCQSDCSFDLTTNDNLVSSPIMDGIATQFDSFKLFHNTTIEITKQQLINYQKEPNPNDWLSYTAWAHQSIQLRKQACKNYHLNFNSMEPTLEQIRQFEKTLYGLQNSPTTSSSILSSPQLKINNNNNNNNNQTDYDVNFDPYQLYREYQQFITKSVTTFDFIDKAVKHQAKAICSAASSLNIEIDLNFDDNQSDLDEEKDETINEFIDDNQTYQSSKQTLLGKLDEPNQPPPTTTTTITNLQNQLTQSSQSVNDCKFIDSSALNRNPLTSVKSWYCLYYVTNDDILLNESNQSISQSGSYVTDSNYNIDNNNQVRHNDGLHDDDNVAVDSVVEKSSKTHKYLSHIELSNRTSDKAQLNQFFDKIDKLSLSLESKLCNITNNQSTPNNNKNVNDQETFEYFDNLLTNLKTCKTDFQKSSNQKSKNNERLNPTTRNDKQININCTNVLHEGDNHRSTSLTGYHDTNVTTTTTTESNLRNTPVMIKPDKVDSVATKNIRTSLKEQVSNSSCSSTASSLYLEKLVRRQFDTQRRISIASVDEITNTASSLNATSTLRSDQLSIGTFLTTLLGRLENFPNNCFYANLYLTNLLSSVAAYPIPLLKAILFLTNLPNLLISSKDTICRNDLCELSDLINHLPYTILQSIKQQFDSFELSYVKKLKKSDLVHVNGLQFHELKQEARQYLNTQADKIKTGITCNKQTNGSGLLNETDVDMHLLANQNCKKHKYIPKWLKNQTKKLKGNFKSKQNYNVTFHSNIPVGFNDFAGNLLNPSLNHNWFPNLNDIHDNHNDSANQLTTPNNNNNNNNNHNIKRSKLTSKLFSRHSPRSGKHLPDNDLESASIDWMQTRNILLACVLFEDFCKELAALCAEHSIQ